MPNSRARSLPRSPRQYRSRITRSRWFIVSWGVESRSQYVMVRSSCFALFRLPDWRYISWVEAPVGATRLSFEIHDMSSGYSAARDGISFAPNSAFLLPCLDTPQTNEVATSRECRATNIIWTAFCCINCRIALDLHRLCTNYACAMLLLYNEMRYGIYKEEYCQWSH